MNSVVIKTNREINSGEFHDLVSGIAHLTSCLRVAASSEAEFGADKTIQKALDGGCRESMEHSLIALCNRLDSIVEDAKRWQCPDSDAHHAGVRYFCQQIEIQEQAIQQNKLTLKSLEERLTNETVALKEGLIRAIESGVTRGSPYAESAQPSQIPQTNPSE